MDNPAAVDLYDVILVTLCLSHVVFIRLCVNACSLPRAAALIDISHQIFSRSQTFSRPASHVCHLSSLPTSYTNAAATLKPSQSSAALTTWSPQTTTSGDIKTLVPSSNTCYSDTVTVSNLGTQALINHGLARIFICPLEWKHLNVCTAALPRFLPPTTPSKRSILRGAAQY